MKTVHWMAMAGLGRNVGYGSNKVFTGPLLESLKASQPLIGIILGLEGLLGLILNPLTGWISDRTSKPGFRRKIYVGVCLPGAAVAWLLFYFLHNPTLAMIVIVLFYLFQQGSASPYQAWMPEVVPASKWGLASGYLNLWWQVGNLIAFLAIPLLWMVNHIAAFVLTSAIMLIGGLLTVILVPEPVVQQIVPQTATGPTDTGSSSIGSHVSRPQYRILLQSNLVLYFIVHLLSWLSFEAVASFFTLFIIHVAGGSQLDSALAMSIFTATGIAAAFLAGKLYRRVSAKVMLSLALAFYGILSLAGLFVHNMAAVFVIVGIEGIFWSSNLTVSFPLASDLLHQIVGDEAVEDRLRGGLFGLNSLMESAGLLIAAPLTGLVIAWSGGNYAGMFAVSAASSLLAIVFVLMIRLKHN